MLLLAIWIAASIVHGQILFTVWGDRLSIIGVAVSMSVNALVTGSIVLRILKVFREVKTSTVDDQVLGVTGGSTLRRVIFALIESGMVLFSIQFVRLVITILSKPDIFLLISCMHAMVNVIMISVSLFT